MIKRWTGLMLAAVLALTLVSCASMPADDFTRDDSQTLPSSATQTDNASQSETEPTDGVTTESIGTQSVTSGDTTEAPPLSVVLLSGGRWRDPADSGEYVSTILFNSGGTFVMTVNTGGARAGNCMGTYTVGDGSVRCVVTERDMVGGPEAFTLEYTGSSLVYRGDAMGAVTDGVGFVR